MTETLVRVPLDAEPFDDDAAGILMADVASEVVDRAELTATGPIVAYSRTEAGLADLRSRFKDRIFDLTTTAGLKEGKAARRSLVVLRTTLARTCKEKKAPVRELEALINSEAARITAEIVALEDPIDAQIKADEARREAIREEAARVEAARMQVHEEGLAKIREYLSRCQAAGMTAARIAAGIAKLEPVTFPPEKWEEFHGVAVSTQADTLQGMRELHAAALERETESARLEALRIELDAREAALKAAALLLVPAPAPVPVPVPAAAPAPIAARELVTIEAATAAPACDQASGMAEAAPAAQAAIATAQRRSSVVELEDRPTPTGLSLVDGPADGALVKLGDIVAMFGPGLAMTAAYAASLGVPGMKGLRGAVLFTQTECRQLLQAHGAKVAVLLQRSAY